MEFHRHVNAVSPLGDSLDGTRPKRSRRTLDKRHGPVVRLDPMLSAWLIDQGVDLLHVEIVTSVEIVVHNHRDWTRLSRT